MALKSLALPLELVTPGDVLRAHRELAQIEEFINQANLRKPGTPLSHLPRTTKGLASFVELNNLNLLNATDRKRGLVFLNQMVEQGKVIHVSFAADPSISFLNRLISWLRREIDPLLLMNVGLEPTIAAGCIVRTDNHVHDFSLRHQFDAQRALLMAKIKETPITK